MRDGFFFLKSANIIIKKRELLAQEVQKRKLSKIEYRHSLRLGQDLNKLDHKKKASSRTEKTKTELKL
jgi:hypothetical protein